MCESQFHFYDSYLKIIFVGFFHIPSFTEIFNTRDTIEVNEDITFSNVSLLFVITIDFSVGSEKISVTLPSSRREFRIWSQIDPSIGHSRDTHAWR